MANKIFKCSPYLDITNSWNISFELRKEMYKLLFIRNDYGFGKNNRSENEIRSIIEYIKYNIHQLKKKYESDSESSNESSYKSPNDSGYESSSENNNRYGSKYEMTPFIINIEINKDDFIPSDKKERFYLYLKIFYSNKWSIKKLPYYLIPLASSLRYYLNMKKQSNQYISFSSSKTNPSINDIYNYEFEALIASSIAALTLTFLNYNVYIKNNRNLLETKTIDIDNYLINEQRLEFKAKRKTDKFYYKLLKNERRNYQLKRETQILAEYRNILSMNSNFLQILKITDDFPELQRVSTMHHYIWEEAFHEIIYYFKKYDNPSVENIITSFLDLFYIDKISDYKYSEYKEYIKHLNLIYHDVKNSVQNKCNL